MSPSVVGLPVAELVLALASGTELTRRGVKEGGERQRKYGKEEVKSGEKTYMITAPNNPLFNVTVATSGAGG